MVEIKTSALAQQLREHLLSEADISEAARVAEHIGNMVIDRLNNFGLPVATHLLAQPLIARACIQTAAEWWAREFAKVPMPETWAAMVDLVLNLPPQLVGETYDTREEGTNDEG